jgi:hypothetical protein
MKMVHTNINTTSNDRNARTLPPQPSHDAYVADMLDKILAENVAIRDELRATMKQIGIIRAIIDDIMYGGDDDQTEH